MFYPLKSFVILHKSIRTPILANNKKNTMFATNETYIFDEFSKKNASNFI